MSSRWLVRPLANGSLTPVYESHPATRHKPVGGCAASIGGGGGGDWYLHPFRAKPPPDHRRRRRRVRGKPVESRDCSRAKSQTDRSEWSEREREREKRERESFSDGPTPSRLRDPMCRSIGSTSRRRARINKPRSPHFPPAISYDSQSLNVSRIDFPPVSLSLSFDISVSLARAPAHRGPVNNKASAARERVFLNKLYSTG